MSLSATRPVFVLRGWHVLAILVAFFGAVIAVNTAFIMTAYKTFPGETSVTPYEDGLLYDNTIKQMRDQAAIGWRITAGAAGDGILVQVFDRAGAPLRGLSVSGDLVRPATEIGRRSLRFAETTPGSYAARGALTGAWDLDLTLTDANGHKALAERRLVAP